MARRKSTFLVWSVTLLGVAGIGSWLLHRDEVAVPLGAAALVLTAVLGALWLFRARTVRRYYAAVDAYAEREIDRARRRHHLQRVRRGSGPRDALPSSSTHGG
jgi:hypothetical protein